MSDGTHAARHALARAPWRRPGGIVVIAVAVVIGLIGSGVLVWHASYAAFTSTTSNGANSFAAGSVKLADDDSNTALFTVSGLTPGATNSNCITVTYNGDLASAGVKVYIATGGLTKGGTGPAYLSDYLTMKVEEGTDTNPNNFGDCTGFSPDASGQPILNNTLTTIAGANTNYASGGGTWAPSSAGSQKVYRFTYTLSATAPDTIQGLSDSATFTWEAHSS
jgi:hypothetical protein